METVEKIHQNIGDRTNYMSTTVLNTANQMNRTSANATQKYILTKLSFCKASF